MTAKMNMKSWYTMRMLKTFFRDVTTQSKTACRAEETQGGRHSESDLSEMCGYNTKILERVQKLHHTLSLGSLLIVLRGRRTLKTLRDFIVLMSLPLLFLVTLEHST